MNVESSPEIRGTIIQEEEFVFETGKVSEFSIPSSENVEFPISRRRRKRPSVKGQTSILAKRRRTRNSTTVEVVHVIGENVEITILKLRASTVTEEPTASEPQIENLIFESELSKEELRTIQDEVQRLKEASKKQMV